MLKKLKNKTANALSRMRELLRKPLRCALAAVSIASIMFLAVQAPQIHKDYLRITVGPSVYKIVKIDEQGRVLGGGTGFAVKTENGNTYTLTNAHVCQAFKGSPDVNVMLEDGTVMPRRILEISDKTDLCLVEAVPGAKGLELAEGIRRGQLVSIVGHPRLKPLTISGGEVVGPQEVKLLDGIIGETMEEKDCQKPKNRIEEFDTFFGHLRVCFTVIQANQTNAVALPGNSGSPVVDWQGNLIGVLFAGDNEVHWGLIISLKDIRDFTKAY